MGAKARAKTDRHDAVVRPIAAEGPHPQTTPTLRQPDFPTAVHPEPVEGRRDLTRK